MMVVCAGGARGCPRVPAALTIPMHHGQHPRRAPKPLLDIYSVSFSLFLSRSLLLSFSLLLLLSLPDSLSLSLARPLSLSFSLSHTRRVLEMAPRHLWTWGFWSCASRSSRGVGGVHGSFPKRQA